MQPNSETPEKKNICIVIVTYFPEQGFLTKYRNLVNESGCMIFVYNHSDPAAIVEIEQFISENKNVQVIQNEVNGGIAKALNQGIQKAKELGFKWVLTLDQDTDFEERILDSLLQIYRESDKKEKIAVIGSNFVNKSSNILWYPSIPANHGWIEKDFVITSGSLHSLEAVDQTSFYQEELFIDDVDIEFCFRARRKGYKVLMSVIPLIRQSVGKAEPCQFLGRKVWTNNCSPLRWYYKTRNHFLILKSYFFREWKWALHTSLSLMKEAIKMVCFERDRRSKWNAIFKGTKNGLTGNLQKFEEACHD